MVLIAFLICGIGLSAQENNNTELVYISTNEKSGISFYQLDDIDFSTWSALDGLSNVEINQYFMDIDGIELFSSSNILIAKIAIENEEAEEIFRSIFQLSSDTINQNIHQN